jgi:hypothetical protein
VLSVHLKTCRHTPRGYVRTNYSAAEVDAIAAYSPALHRGFLIPISEASGRSAIHLRLEPTRNNQAQGIKWARDYELASSIERLRPRPRLILPDRGGYTSELTLGL